MPLLVLRIPERVGRRLMRVKVRKPADMITTFMAFGKKSQEISSDFS
jgi:hypothetical protein